jgi:hypothetical protein
MPSLYIANMSKQHHDFAFRLKGDPSIRYQSIRIGTQSRIAGDLPLPMIEDIIQQHQRYGLKSVEEASRCRGFVGLCYSIGDPVKLFDQPDRLDEIQARNSEALNDRAEAIREDTAGAIATKIQETMHEAGVEVPRSELTIVEETREGTPKVANGYEVNHDATGQSRHRGAKQGRRSRR